MNTFVINNKRYVAKELTFGAIRQFENNGLSLSDISNKPMSLASNYLAFCSAMNIDAADNEIQEHVINGGSLEGVFDAVMGAMNESRFFQALNKKAEAAAEEPVQEIRETEPQIVNAEVTQ